MEFLCFLAGLALGSSVILWKRRHVVDTERYEPSSVEHEIAMLLEPDELNFCAYLYRGEGLAGYEVKEGRLN